MSYFECFSHYTFAHVKLNGMSVIYILISISIVVAVFFVLAFLRAVKSGQYDDDYTPSVRMLFDDELKKTKTNNKVSNTQSDKNS
jgi:cbb3-type cytochrome oxidase maturation protein